MTEYLTIDVRIDGGVCVVTQNRPETLNARNSQMYAELIAALHEASERPDVAMVLLTGAGRMFCAGMDFNNDARMATRVLESDPPRVGDVKASLADVPPERAHFELARRFVAAFIEFDKPLVAAVNGAAIGEGFSSLLHCDVLYATADAYFWAPFARAGAAPEFCATLLAGKRLGVTLGNAALYLARRISAEEARQAGFVLEVLPQAGFVEAVLARLHDGLALAGPPDMRADTLQRFRALVHSPEQRAALHARSDQEFELLRLRATRGDGARVREYYAAQLPRRKPPPQA